MNDAERLKVMVALLGEARAYAVTAACSTSSTEPNNWIWISATDNALNEYRESRTSVPSAPAPVVPDQLTLVKADRDRLITAVDSCMDLIRADAIERVRLVQEAAELRRKLEQADRELQALKEQRA